MTGVKLQILPVSVLVLTALLSGCVLLQASERGSDATPTPAMVTQWAIAATASSQYGIPDWSARRATGAPEIAACRDDARAWASARGNGVEWLELRYAVPVQAFEVRVVQSYGRGAVSRITLIDALGTATVVWEGEDTHEPCPGVLVARFLPPDHPVVVVRVDLDESRTGWWNQIDAVALVGAPWE